MKVIVLHNQSLFDVALQHTGTIESLFELALANGISVTDDLTAGTPLSLGEGQRVRNKDVLDYYTAKKIQPATGFTQTDLQILERLEGISIWAINLDFKVS